MNSSNRKRENKSKEQYKAYTGNCMAINYSLHIYGVYVMHMCRNDLNLNLNLGGGLLSYVMPHSLTLFIHNIKIIHNIEYHIVVQSAA